MRKLLCLFTTICLLGCSKSKDPVSAENSITLFQLEINGELITGQISQSSNTITFELVDAELASLRPKITISEGATISPSATAPQNFGQEVKYTVTAENGVSNTYTVLVENRISSAENLITSFQLPIDGENVLGEIDQTGNTITFDLVGADLESLTPLVEISEDATVNPALNSSMGFNEDVTYVVTAENGETRTYTIIVNNRVFSTESDILSFTVGINGEDIEARVDNDLKEIAFETGSFNITRLLPEITVSENATISPASGEAVDFTNPVTYIVTAENGETEEYTIKINQAYSIGPIAQLGFNSSAGAFLAYTRAQISVSIKFLDPSLPGAQVYLYDGTNKIILPNLSVEMSESRRIIYYRMMTVIPENTITSSTYKLVYESDDLIVESDIFIDILAEGAPKISGTNQTSYSRGDTLIVTGENLTPVIVVPSNGNLYVFNPAGSIETRLNPEKTEYNLLLEGPASFTNTAFFFYSGDTREVIFTNLEEYRLGEQITVNVIK